jgi:hypothetical protein
VSLALSAQLPRLRDFFLGHNLKMGADPNPRLLRPVDLDVGDAQPRGKSISTLVVPIGLVGILGANMLWIGFTIGHKDDKLDNVVDAVKEIKTEMYRRSDAEVLNVKLDGLDKRVSALEAVHQRRVEVVTAKVERQEDDLLTRAQHWLTGAKR